MYIHTPASLSELRRPSGHISRRRPRWSLAQPKVPRHLRAVRNSVPPPPGIRYPGHRPAEGHFRPSNSTWQRRISTQEILTKPSTPYWTQNAMFSTAGPRFGPPAFFVGLHCQLLLSARAAVFDVALQPVLRAPVSTLPARALSLSSRLRRAFAFSSNRGLTCAAAVRSCCRPGRA